MTILKNLMSTIFDHNYCNTFSQVHDSVQVDIATGKIQDTIRFDTGNLCMITGGANSGRVGTIMSRYETELRNKKLCNDESLSCSFDVFLGMRMKPNGTIYLNWLLKFSLFFYCIV